MFSLTPCYLRGSSQVQGRDTSCYHNDTVVDPACRHSQGLTFHWQVDVQHCGTDHHVIHFPDSIVRFFRGETVVAVRNCSVLLIVT